MINANSVPTPSVSLTNQLIDKFDMRKADSKDKDRLLEVLLRYLVLPNQLKAYSKTNRIIKDEFGNAASLTFKKFLSAISDDFMRYILVNCRSFFRYEKILLGRSLKVSDKDSLSKLKSSSVTPIDFSQILEFDEFPTIETVLRNQEGFIVNCANRLILAFGSDESSTVDDLIAELNIKIMEIYRQYIFCFGMANVNLDVLYSIIQQGVKTRAIDLVRHSHADVRIINTVAQSYEELFCDFHEGSEDNYDDVNFC